ncbi:protein NCA1-like isoform X2 [Rhododendron vialii]|uniref:protein NCA1-like isoform X2 n=1 Tax=Rhododendron vialii TaxID=182163 RepID=UPI00265FFC08|nr:protein NCA1-like isoform X2 [Rhododendron vialii]
MHYKEAWFGSILLLFSFYKNKVVFPTWQPLEDHHLHPFFLPHRVLGDASSAITYFEESVNFLKKVPTDDLEIIHTLSVSLNKVGDLKYYDEELQGARSYYFQSLNVSRDAIKNHPSSPSQVCGWLWEQKGYKLGKEVCFK